MSDETPKLQRASNSSDAALLLSEMAEQLAAAAGQVVEWAKLNKPADLAQIADVIDRAHATLRAGLLAQIDADRPSLQQLEWKAKILDAVSLRTSDALRAMPFPWAAFGEPSPKWKAAKEAHDEAYAASLAATRELRAHPDWVPKNKRKPKARKR